ncbi:CDP-alcohol phosphatidyltransferase family protein [Novosphingobium huizhouense]|uniref:CDP-alcohol phosphatidyltransferase family protein n=1 Tax=Novosphingobium huizhouense TaxID=2866625 RepID=UPI001CD88D47|nr:CDP-alcohol phosphatidyltransferase family protein [Novosphingobium huizhouense]
MFDARLRPLIDPPLNRLGAWLAALGLSANAVTFAGLAVGLAAGVAVALGHTGLALALVCANRLLDGLDGAIARATRLTDWGGYLDIVVDFAFYVAVPVGFAVQSPANLLPAVLLIASFTLTGTSFLAFATIAAKRGLETSAHGRKSFFYNTGLAEGSETIAAFVAMCLLPDRFPQIACAYAALCVATVVQRTLVARATFAQEP